MVNYHVAKSQITRKLYQVQLLAWWIKCNSNKIPMLQTG